MYYGIKKSIFFLINGNKKDKRNNQSVTIYAIYVIGEL